MKPKEGWGRQRSHRTVVLTEKKLPEVDYQGHFKDNETILYAL